MTEAAKLLFFSDKPIIEVAFICGYESQQAFSVAFKSMYKIPPAEYRDNGTFYPLQLRFSLYRNIANRVFTKDDICFAEKTDLTAWMELRLLKKHGSEYSREAAQIEKRIRSIVAQFREKLDPAGTISPEVPDPIATPNIRNVVLEDRIYSLRMEELRTFAEIGVIVGLTASAVSRLFRRTYRDRHGVSATIPKLVRKYKIRTLVTD